MSYLLTQMFLYMLATFILGLILGWLIWRYGQSSSGDYDAMLAERNALAKERDDLKVNLDACRTRSAKERETLEALRNDKIDLQNRLDGMTVKANAMPKVAPAAAVAAVATAAPAKAPAKAAPAKASKPESLKAARGGKADELQLINGVGPKLEKLLHSLGYFHFDQIGAWSKSDLAWVDENLEGFKGRATRDKWVPQAKVLAKKK